MKPYFYASFSQLLPFLVFAIIGLDNRLDYHTQLTSSQGFLPIVTDHNRRHTEQGPLFNVHVAVNVVSYLNLDPILLVFDDSF